MRKRKEYLTFLLKMIMICEAAAVQSLRARVIKAKTQYLTGFRGEMSTATGGSPRSVGNMSTHSSIRPWKKIVTQFSKKTLLNNHQILKMCFQEYKQHRSAGTSRKNWKTLSDTRRQTVHHFEAKRPILECMCLLVNYGSNLTRKLEHSNTQHAPIRIK